MLHIIFSAAYIFLSSVYNDERETTTLLNGKINMHPQEMRDGDCYFSHIFHLGAAASSSESEKLQRNSVS